MNVILLLRLLSAHILADFFLQNNKLCNAKSEKGSSGIKAQLLHSLIHAACAYILLGDWCGWIIPLIIFVSHLIVDIVKVQTKANGTKGFIFDQIVHIIILFILWWMIYADCAELASWFVNIVTSKSLWALLIGYLLILKPASVMIGHFMKGWIPSNNMQVQGLPHAGEWIGYIERTLIVTFVITGNVEAVGFLLTAKSVFRFGDLNKAKEIKTTEYVLLGTLASFTIALFVAFVLNSVIH